MAGLTPARSPTLPPGSADNRVAVSPEMKVSKMLDLVDANGSPENLAAADYFDLPLADSHCLKATMPTMSTSTAQSLPITPH